MNEVKQLELSVNEFNINQGYEYQQNNFTFFEFHIDDHESFHTRCQYLPFRGHLSVQKPENTKPIIKIGQDEACYKQYAQTFDQWYLPDGSLQINPKNEGDGVMLSVFM